MRRFHDYYQNFKIRPMMSSKSTRSGVKGLEESFIMPTDVKKVGYMKKLKTMKKKYFVLRDNNDTNLGNLSYYDSEKKFKSLNTPPKRVIYLKDCFSINRKIDGKHKYVIALYTRDDCFTTVLDDETSLKEWLEALIELQSLGIDFKTGHNIHYDHVWQVNINRNGLGQTRNMNGNHRLCLTSSTLCIVKVDPQTDNPDVYEFPLISIRRCGHTSSTFFIELGRSSSIGPGDIWIQADDSAISQNMHEVILSAMRSSKGHEDFGPSQRPRSASTSDKPISTRRPTQTSHTNQNVVVFGTSYSSTTTSTSVLSSSVTKGSIRERCDSMPSRSRTTSESDGSTHESKHWTSVHYQPSDRLHSGIHGRTLSYSPPSLNPLSSAACSTDSAGSSLSIDDYDSSHCLTPMSDHHSGLHNSVIPSEPPISEEEVQIDDYLSMSPSNSSTTNQSGIRSHLNLNIRANNTSPMTSPTFGSVKSMTQSIKEDNSPYMPMSPVGSLETESLSSSRRSSGLEKILTNESNSEYMPMISMSLMSSQEIKSITSEEYLNMAPLSESLPKSECLSYDNNTIKEEYHLEKVKSYFPNNENESFDSFLPPVRAYSIGSRPQTKPIMKSKSRQLLPKSGTQTPEEEETRMRAFSMGANAREMRIAAKKQLQIEAQIGGPTVPIEEVSRHSKKASSAPTLSPIQPRKRSATVGSRPVFNRPGVNVDRSDTDLMEIDYSKSMHSKQIREKIEDRIKRSAVQYRQRSNSRSSTCSSGIGSTSTTSPSMTSSMSELNEKKREMTSTSLTHKSSDDRTVHSGKDVNNDYLLITSPNPNPEPKQSSSHRPTTGQLSQHLPTVPSKHSLPQSHCKPLPTNQTNLSKAETFAQKSEEKPINTKKSDDNGKDGGDYVCLDIRSTAYVSQTTAVPSEDKSSHFGNKFVPKLSSMNENKTDFVPKNEINIKVENISQNETKSENTFETDFRGQTSLTTTDIDIRSGQGSDSTLQESQTITSNKSINYENISDIMSKTSKDLNANQTESISESISLGLTPNSRPSSVSSERELNYASLDLAPTSTVPNTIVYDQSGEQKPLSPQPSAKCGPQSSLLNVTPTSSSCSTPVAPILSCCGSQELLYSSDQLSYAEIDFGIANKKIGKS